MSCSATDHTTYIQPVSGSSSSFGDYRYSHSTLSLLDCYLVHPAHQLVCYLIHVLFHLLHQSKHHSKQHPSKDKDPNQKSGLPAPFKVHRPAILITSNAFDEQNRVPVDLALNFAAIGYHVFLQVSSQAQQAEVIVRWQRLKSSLNKRLRLNININRTGTGTGTTARETNHLRSSSSIYHPSLFFNRCPHLGLTSKPPKSKPTTSTIGSLIPLLYLSNELPQRLKAISTIAAYLPHNAIDMLSLINIHLPNHIRFSPARSPTLLSRLNSRSLRSASASSLDHPQACRPLTGCSSPPNSDHSSHIPSPPLPPLKLDPSTPTSTDFYPTAPLPLAITSDSFLLDALNDLLIAPLSTIQDLLPLLHSHNGRVINIWDSPRPPQPGLRRLLPDALATISHTLHAELDPLGIPVSFLFAPLQPPSLGSRAKSSPPATITTDVRSILTDASDPDMLDLFSIQSAREHAHHTQARPSDPARTFATTRAILETSCPGRSYPIGMRELAREFSNLRGPLGWVFRTFGGRED